MSVELRHSFLFAGFMCLMAITAQLLAPKRLMSNELGPLSLTDDIPAKIGDWSPDVGSDVVVDPVGTEAAMTVYSQILARTYKNGGGERVMLSVAYGNNQRRTKLHLPEGCYVSQGYRVGSERNANLNLHQGNLPVRQFEAALGSARVESVTYWIVYGDRLASADLGGRRTLFELELAGRIPDGMVIRVSSLGRDVEKQLGTQQDFIDAFSLALTKETRLRFFRFSS